MKILLINTFDIIGGAARAAYRLHRGLLGLGIDSQMLVQSKKSDDYTVIGPETKIEKAISYIRPILDQLPLKRYRNRNKAFFSPAILPFSNVLKRIKKNSPDVVHLNWICGGMISIAELAKINKPIVWTVHDMWAFTGGCHYDEGCGKYEEICGNCPVLYSNKQDDLSKLIFRKKQKAFKDLNFSIVAPCRWLADCVRNSSLLKNKRVEVIPNGIDTAIYKPVGKKVARDIIGLPQEKKLVLFGAIGGLNNPRKGFKLIETLKRIKDINIEVVIFGASKPIEDMDYRFKTHYLGHLNDDLSLTLIYGAADVMVVPSFQEAFGQTASEAMACGTPVVAFASTGLLDIIDHQKSGYLARPFESEDLANGIEWVLNAPNYDELCQNARKKVLKEFDSRTVAKRYIDLYKEILKL